MRRWSVGGALIPTGDGLVLVGNRRRDGSLEWTPPGGVIDAGESLLEGLEREVREETGLVVARWSHRTYTVTVDAPDMGWRLTVEAWVAAEVTGEVLIDDPDGIVEEVRHVPAGDAIGLLVASPPWVHVPVGDWLEGGSSSDYGFVLRGEHRSSSSIERVR
jgi:8-oxo-dGTP diphosphatase